MLNELINLDQQLLLHLNGSDSDYWDGVWVIITSVGTWIPFYFSLLYLFGRSFDFRKLLLFILMIALAILLADQVASGICKPYFHRFRPSHEPLLAGKVDIVRGRVGGLYGFMSSHAANGFAIFTLISLVVRYHTLSFTLFLYAVFTSFSRIYLGLHYPGDIVCGALWGVVSGFISYYLFKYLSFRFFPERKFYSDAYTQSGFVKEHVSVPIFVFFLTLVTILIVAFFWARTSLS